MPPQTLAAVFLRQNRDLVDGIVQYLNKQQTMHKAILMGLTGEDVKLNAIVTDKVLDAVDKHGPDVLIQLLGAIEAQMDQVMATIQAASEQAAAEVEQAVIMGPDPMQVTFVDPPADAGAVQHDE